MTDLFYAKTAHVYSVKVFLSSVRNFNVRYPVQNTHKMAKMAQNATYTENNHKH